MGLSTTKLCGIGGSRTRENTELLASSIVMFNIGEATFEQVSYALPDVMRRCIELTTLDWNSMHMYRVLTFLRYYSNINIAHELVDTIHTLYIYH